MPPDLLTRSGGRIVEWSVQPDAARPYARLFTPKRYITSRVGYEWNNLRQHAIAGVTVAIVALPLAMTLAMASGTAPEKRQAARLLRPGFRHVFRDQVAPAFDAELRLSRHLAGKMATNDGAGA